MKILDLHCDTLSKMGESKGTNLRNNKFSVDFERLKSSGYMAQFFAIFMDSRSHDPYEWALNLADIFKNEISKNTDLVRQAYNYEDILSNDKESHVSCILTLEEGAALRGNIDNLKKFYEIGVRLITLTWNYPNQIGYPNCIARYRMKGLTEFGFELIDEMNRLGMVVDVSHLSDKGFFDVAERSKAPFIASHSNARAVTNNPRNLTDEMIKKIAQIGGVIGINFFASFLGSGNVSRVDDMLKHIRHIYNVGGSEVLALGSDFDGISSEVEFGDCSGMDVLYESLKKGGFSEAQADGMFYGNVLRVLKEVLK